MLKRTVVPILVPALAAVLLMAACGSDDGADVRVIDDGSGSASASGSVSASGSGSASASAPTECLTAEQLDAETVVGVDLGEWFVGPEAAGAAAGSVGFVADNVGEEPHELVVVRAETPDDLPVEDGMVQEDQLPEGDFQGEIDAFPAGDTCAGQFELEAGEYVLFCNIVEVEEDGTLESHFELGMRATFEVTG